MNKIKYLLLFYYLLTFLSTNGRNINIKFYASLYKTKNPSQLLYSLLQNKKITNGDTITFPQDTYYFSPIDRDVCLTLENLSDITIDGKNSKFIYHGICQPLYVYKSSNINIQNFTIDWDTTYVIQADIIKHNKDFIDITIDSQKYPFIIKNKKLYLKYDDKELPIITSNQNLYNKKTKEIVPGSWDNNLGNVFEEECISIDPNKIRFLTKSTSTKFYNDKKIILRTLHPFRDAICIEKSNQISLKNIHINYCPGAAIRLQHVNNVNIENSFASIDSISNRVFSSEQDNLHANNCKGIIKISHCSPSGMGDDAINIHGRYYKLLAIEDSHNVTVQIVNTLPEIDEFFWFVDHKNMKRTKSCQIQQISTRINPQNHSIEAHISFKEAIPYSIKVGDYLESKTWTPEVDISYCDFGRQNRARGILVTTPQKVRIHHNYFHTAGTAIMIAGDVNHFFESGSCNDIEIYNNTFDNCVTSGTAYNGWGTATIMINPDLFNKETQYHNNINIHNNNFKNTYSHLLYAKSVNGLSFHHNRYKIRKKYKPIIIENCKNYRIE